MSSSPVPPLEQENQPITSARSSQKPPPEADQSMSTASGSYYTPHNLSTHIKQLIIKNHTLTDDSFSSSNMTSNLSNDSTPAIIFGPQDTPFALRRHQMAQANQSTPFKPPHHRPSRRVSIRADPSMVRLSFDEEEEMEFQKKLYESEHPVEDVDEEVVEIQLSSWRQEQIRKFRAPRKLSGSPPRPIPALHGPLSLPYARNPSGVDATLADDDVHLSHIFGLRAIPHTYAPGVRPTIKLDYPKAVLINTRSVSSGTTTSSSGPETARTVSGSSMESNSQLIKKREISTVSDGKTASSEGSQGGSIFVQRDPHQYIGLRTKPSDAPTKTSAQLSITQPKPITISAPPITNSATRSDLGHGKPRLSPIPGSPLRPNDNRDPFHIDTSRFIDPAIQSAGMSLPVKVPPITHFGQSFPAPPSTFISPALFPIAARPDHHATPQTLVRSMGTAVRLDSNELAEVPTSTPRKPSAESATSAQGSKADASDNWRVKPKAETLLESEKKRISSAIRVVAQEDQVPMKTEDVVVKGEIAKKNEILTIDGLFKKFGKADGESAKSAESVSEIKAENITSAAPIPSTSQAATPAPKPSKPLGEIKENLPSLQKSHIPIRASPKSRASTKVTPAVVNKTLSTHMKGTPNAGKLLKRAYNPTLGRAGRGKVPLPEDGEGLKNAGQENAEAGGSHSPTARKGKKKGAQK